MPSDSPSRQIDWAARDEAIRQARDEVAQLCARDALPLPWGPYEAAPITCFRCNRRIIVYTWLHHTVRSGHTPPAPWPHTVQRRTTQMSFGESYWANTCACCGATQGDHFLYEEYGAPLRMPWHRLNGAYDRSRHGRR